MLAYKIFIEVPDFRKPQQGSQLANCFCEKKFRAIYKVINMECVHLNQRFQLTANQRIRILHDIICADRVNRQARSISCLELSQIHLLLGCGPGRMRPMPDILYHAEQYCMQNFYRRVARSIKACKIGNYNILKTEREE